MPPGQAGPHFQSRLPRGAWRPELASRPPCRGLKQATSHQTAENRGRVPKGATECKPRPAAAKGRATPGVPGTAEQERSGEEHFGCRKGPPAWDPTPLKITLQSEGEADTVMNLPHRGRSKFFRERRMTAARRRNASEKGQEEEERGDFLILN